MLSILSVTFPFFALVLCGFAATRSRLLPLEAIGGLNSFVLFFALPCMLFRFGSGTPIAELLDAGVFGVYLLCALTLVGLTVLCTRNRGRGGAIGWNDAAFGALVAAFPNTGFMGVPLLVALLGPAAAGPAIVTMVVDMVVTSSLCIALSRLDALDQHGATAAARKALKGVLLNPMPWSILLGALASALHWAPPGPLGRTVALLADAASPVALFTMGAVLARAQGLPEAGRPRQRLGDVPLLGFIKLLLHPLLVWGLGRGAMALGLPLSAAALKVLVLVAALPSASNVSMLSERFGADTGRVARVILLSTVAAFLSFAGAVACFA
ncbi:MAG: AEC family transporter [Curvibacter sp.]|nr:AEC family transporter [Curvibacter sp.]